MYSILSEYGTHATIDGFQLISQNNSFVLGPFESETILKASIEQTCEVLPYAVIIFLGHWKTLTPTMLKQKCQFLIHTQKWWKQYMNSDFDGINIDELEMMATKARTTP
jgi:hypothetical protein